MGTARRAIAFPLVAALVAHVACGCGTATTQAALDASLEAETPSDAPSSDAVEDRGASLDGAPDHTSAGDGGALTFAVIGDYGVCGAGDAGGAQYSVSCAQEEAVAAMVHAWTPLAIFTTGDNSYGSGMAAQIPGDQKPYDDYITAGAFFPCLGNHDWLTSNAAPSLAYFHMTATHYAKSYGAILTAYFLDTNDGDDAGDTAQSAQAAWLGGELAASTTTWNVTFNHQAPYSSCGEFSYDGSGGRGDFRWVAAPKNDVVFSGHSHVYERLAEPSFDGTKTLPYVVVGVSGAPLQGACATKLPGQMKAIYGKWGAMKLDVSASTLSATFYAMDGAPYDSFTLTK